MTGKGQATIPKRLRERHGISAPGRVQFVETDDGSVRAALARLEELGVSVYSPEGCWETAAAFKTRFDRPLGDVYALATADALDGTLLAGADDDFEGVAVPIERFRDEPA